MARWNTIDDLLAKIEMVTESGCWIWMGEINKKGYGRTNFNNKRMVIHRVFYEHFIGPIKDELQLDHLCRVRCCGNPWHTEPVTCQMNILRADGIAAMRASQTHCVNGHELSGDNLYVIPPGRESRGRQCRACARRRAHEAKARRRLNCQSVKSDDSTITWDAKATERDKR